MRVLCIDKARSLSFMDRPVPEPADTEVLVQVDTISVCGSDIHLFEGTYNGPKRYPILFGHEWSGRVVKTGAAVTAFQAGDKVTGDCSRYCGSCELCGLDKNLCRFIEKYGITVDGASAEFILRDERYLYKLPSSMRLKYGSLAEPVAVSANIITRIRETLKGDISRKNILICGAGGIGLGALLLLKYRYGCSRIAVTDISPVRLKTALDFGASLEEGSPEKSGDGNYADIYSSAKYDVILETTGHPEVFASAFELIKPLGVIGCLGMIAEAVIPQKLIVLKALTIVGSIGGTGYFDEVIDFLSRHEAEADKLISHSFKADTKEAVVEAFSAAKDNKRAIKVQIAF